MADEKIKNSSELEFAVFCIENVAAKLGVDAERVYQAFTEQSDILNGYIVPEYEVLHTQSREYIVDRLVHKFGCIVVHIGSYECRQVQAGLCLCKRFVFNHLIRDFRGGRTIRDFVYRRGL